MSSTTSKQITFLKLIADYKIEIPIIQRDYAQGRKGKEELRKNFLGALHNAITKQVPLELDFVYGSVKDKVLQPLDGQQRLTTLFLLHWYIATKENKLDTKVKDLITKFTYETRTSSREFCNDLINKGIKLSKEQAVSELIIDTPWFFLSWKKDPTIKSMLTMLDSIHQEFNSGTELWDKLNNISFQYIELEKFGLSDDLYIKMNARGKALTEFENFKAKFEQYIKKVIYKKNEKGEKIIDKDDWEKDIENPEKTFSHKIDTTWTDLFWNYRGDDNLVDNEFEKFIAQIAINNYAQNREIIENEEIDNIIKKELQAKSKGTDVSDEAIKRERIEQRIAELFKNPNLIKPEDFSNEDSFRYLKNCFDKYAEKKIYDYCNSELFPKGLDLWDYCPSVSSIFKILISEKSTTYKKRVLFYAQTHYLLKAETVDTEVFTDWIRVVRNIVHNSTIDSAATFIGSITLVRELANGCNNIYEYLSTTEINSTFGSIQVIEEIRKAKFILKEGIWKPLIQRAEDHLMFKGSINFLIDNNIDDFETIVNNSYLLFGEDGTIEKFNIDLLLFKVFISQFSKWEQLWGWEFNGSASSWKSIFLKESLKEPFQKIMKINKIDREILECLIKTTNDGDDFKDPIRQLVYKDLINTEWRNLFEGGFKLNYGHNNHFLSPYNAKADWKKYVIGSKRNKFLSVGISDGIIKLKKQNQQLKNNNNDFISYFWGRDIAFIFDNKEFIWTSDQQIKYAENSKPIPEELSIKEFGFFLETFSNGIN